MGRRSEQRIAIFLPITVRGVDGNGNPYVQTFQTRDISRLGARIDGLAYLAVQGARIEIECRGQSVKFTVIWTGPLGTALEGQAGVLCLEPEKYLWGVPLGSPAPDNYEVRPSEQEHSVSGALARPSARTPAWAGTDRRRYPRKPCRMEADVAKAGTPGNFPATVTDISLGGCYLEMLTPLPVATVVELRINSSAGQLQVRGRVRSSQEGMGMGLAFLEMGAEDLRRLRKVAPPAPGAPQPVVTGLRGEPIARRPKPGVVSAAPGALTQKAPSDHEAIASDALEAILRLLTRKGILSRAEFFEEVERLKRDKA